MGLAINKIKYFFKKKIAGKIKTMPTGISHKVFLILSYLIKSESGLVDYTPLTALLFVAIFFILTYIHSATLIILAIIVCFLVYFYIFYKR